MLLHGADLTQNFVEPCKKTLFFAVVELASSLLLVIITKSCVNKILYIFWGYMFKRFVRSGSFYLTIIIIVCNFRAFK